MLYVRNSNRVVGAGIMHRVKVFMRKNVTHNVTFLHVITISFPNCMCTATSFHNALIGSPVALVLKIVKSLVLRKEHIAFKSTVTDKMEGCGQDVEAEAFQSPTVNMIQFMLMS